MSAYDDAYAEVIANYKKGGVDRPTSTMKATMRGQFLRMVRQGLRETPHVARGTAQVDGYFVTRQTKKRIWMSACENQRALHFYNKKTDKKKDLGVSGLLVRDVLMIKGSDGRWRVDRTIANEFIAPEDWQDQDCVAKSERAE